MSLEDLKTIVKEAPLSRVVGQYLPLKKNGHYYTALCPFHSDSNPSLIVNDQRKMFMCFACDTGGDVITFVQKYKNIDFLDSLREISKILGLDFNSFNLGKKEKNPKLENAKKLLEIVSKIYFSIGKEGSSHHFGDFTKDRELPKNWVETFQIGFSRNRSTINNYIETFENLKTKNILQKLALELGLIKRDRNNPNKFYDTFRDRIIFPIWDQFGSVQGFTSRAIHPNQKPKYLNSPASFLFDKKNLLYPLHLSKPKMREKDQVIICEGNMDAIALHKNGFKNSIAIMGTSLGDSSLSLIKNITRNIFLCLDNDPAGLKATKKINNQFMSIGIIPNFIDLGPYKDPDEFLTKEGNLAFEEKIKSSAPFLDKMINDLTSKSEEGDTEGKISILNKVFEVISPLGKDLSATERIISIAKKLGFQSNPLKIEESYITYLQGIKTPHNALSKKPSTPPPIQKQEVEKNLLPKSAKQKVHIPRSERAFIKIASQHPELLLSNDFSEILDLVVNTEVQRYISRLRNLIYEIEDREYHSFVEGLMMGEETPIEIKEIVGAALYQLAPRSVEEKVRNRFFSDIKIELKRDSLKRDKKSFLEKLKQLSSDEEIKNIMNQLYKIENDLQSLKSQKAHI